MVKNISAGECKADRERRGLLIGALGRFTKRGPVRGSPDGPSYPGTVTVTGRSSRQSARSRIASGTVSPHPPQPACIPFPTWAQILLPSHISWMLVAVIECMYGSVLQSAKLAAR